METVQSQYVDESNAVRQSLHEEPQRGGLFGRPDPLDADCVGTGRAANGLSKSGFFGVFCRLV